MLVINSCGTLAVPTLSGKEIPVTGVIFMDRIYALKCCQLALTDVKQSKDDLLDDVLKFAIK